MRHATAGTRIFSWFLINQQVFHTPIPVMRRHENMNSFASQPTPVVGIVPYYASTPDSLLGAYDDLTDKEVAVVLKVNANSFVTAVKSLQLLFQKDDVVKSFPSHPVDLIAIMKAIEETPAFGQLMKIVDGTTPAVQNEPNQFPAATRTITL